MKTSVGMKNKGFTLIELVIAIVILGILAVVAAPRFLNLQKDSKVAVMETVEAAMRAGLEMVHTRAIVEGLDQGEQEIVINGVVVAPVAVLGPQLVLGQHVSLHELYLGDPVLAQRARVVVGAGRHARTVLKIGLKVVPKRGANRRAALRHVEPGELPIRTELSTRQGNRGVRIGSSGSRGAQPLHIHVMCHVVQLLLQAAERRQVALWRAPRLGEPWLFEE